MLETRWCAECAGDREFTRFDCADHGDDCVELVCVDCGAGVESAPARGVRPAAPARIDTAA